MGYPRRCSNLKRRTPMTTEDIILQIFYLVATSLPAIPRHSQAKLYPSELVTIGILFALKGGYFRAFYRWLKRDDGTWFGGGWRSSEYRTTLCGTGLSTSSRAQLIW